MHPVHFSSTGSKNNIRSAMTEHHPAVTSNQVVVDYGSTARVSSSPSPSASRTQRLPSFVLINESPNPNPNPQRYTRMSHNKLENESQRPWDRLEYVLNVLNQMCIGFITIYMSYITLRTGLQGTGLHAWLVTIGVSSLWDKIKLTIIINISHLLNCSSRFSWRRESWSIMATMC